MKSEGGLGPGNRGCELSMVDIYEVTNEYDKLLVSAYLLHEAISLSHPPKCAARNEPWCISYDSVRGGKRVLTVETVPQCSDEMEFDAIEKPR